MSEVFIAVCLFIILRWICIIFLRIKADQELKEHLEDVIWKIEKQKDELGDVAASRLELLRQYEWVDVFIDNGGYGDKWIKQCLCCKSEQGDGHADDCEMAEGVG